MWPETVIINKVDFLREFVGMKKKEGLYEFIFSPSCTIQTGLGMFSHH